MADIDDTSAGDQTGYSPEDWATAERLIDDHYDLLESIARANRRRTRMRDTMGTIDILHEGYLKLRGRSDWASSEHFIRAAILAMRCVIVDHVRQKSRQKRGGGADHVPLDDEVMMPEFADTPDQVVVIADLLEQLEKVRPRWMMIVDARYFGGMTEVETAHSLGISARTVRREWREARDWLARKLGEPK